MKFKDINPKSLYRANDPVTSKDAAGSIKTSSLQKVVYDTIASYKNGCNSDQVVSKIMSRHQIAYSSITSRYCELERIGLIEYVGTKKSKSGRNQRIMRIV